MPDQAQDKRPHLVLTNTSTAQPFTAPSGGGSSEEVPKRNRAEHGAALQAQLLALRPISDQAAEAQTERGLQSGLGLQIQFVGLPDVSLAFESLGDERSRDPGKQIEVLSVMTDGNTTVANVFVPEGKLEHFEKYVAEYVAAKVNKNGDLIDHGRLLNAIASIRRAELRALLDRRSRAVASGRRRKVLVGSLVAGAWTSRRSRGRLPKADGFGRVPGQRTSDQLPRADGCAHARVAAAA